MRRENIKNLGKEPVENINVNVAKINIRIIWMDIAYECQWIFNPQWLTFILAFTLK